MIKCAAVACPTTATVEVAWPGKGWVPYCLTHAAHAETILKELGPDTVTRPLDSDLSSVGPETNPQFPGKVPILTVCPKCKEDISQHAFCFQYTVQEVELSPIAISPELQRLRGGSGSVLTSMQPTTGKLVVRTRVGVGYPQRCPKCAWPLWWGDPPPAP